ncbi:MAG TPA: glycoside hydrolase family 43 protein [Deinococcales bacterium]|nr:glycoside hydrolase family 43 protein [Deinococcales bacterium]
MSFLPPSLLPLAVALLAAAQAWIGPQPGTAPRPVYANPVLNQDFPDPSVLPTGGRYYAFATEGNGRHVQVASSANLTDWTAPAEALPEWGRWALGDTWAPSVTAGGPLGFLMYYTARDSKSGRQCIGVATASRPEGPYRDDEAKPLVCQADDGGSIDPDAFSDQAGRRYLVWKNDGNCCGIGTRIYGAPLGPDGLKLAGTPKVLTAADQVSDAGLIEGPSVTLANGRYVLLYSAGRWDTEDYRVNFATASSPLGPYRKPENNTILRSNAAAAGPGGQGVVTDGLGRTWLYYHAWAPDAVGYPDGARSLRLDPIDLSSATPVVSGPSGQPRPGPVTRRGP